MFIAYSRPYKYTQAIIDILKIENSLMLQDPKTYTDDKMAENTTWEETFEITVPGQFVYERSLLCITLSGIPVPTIKITAIKKDGLRKKKEAVVVTSRVHPGETNASFVFQGMLE